MTVTISNISGIGPQTAEILTKHGFETVKAIAESTVEKLSSVPGFGAARARTTISAATALLAN
ncbi:MAG: helix-hairpin-helix domain-containing protein, partial [Gammaproteobacteria bacterium]|nr:helix-hairpin-helix domain-containing protein [Gammaproteobacteria bacterium]